MPTIWKWTKKREKNKNENQTEEIMELTVLEIVLSLCLSFAKNKHFT